MARLAHNEDAVAAMRAGAHDYLMKNSLARLLPPVERALHEAEERRQRRRAEEALRMAQKAGSLGLMAGGIAHDFNNLLVALPAQCSLAMMKLPPDSLARDPIGKAVKAAERAATLTRQRLHYAGGGRQEIEPLDVNGLVQENLGLLQAAIPKHVALRARLTDGLPTILGDPGQLQQVVMNLIINGAEAISQPSGTVTVTTERCDVANSKLQSWGFIEEGPAPGAYVVLTLQDDGDAVSEATRARSFDPFLTTKKHGRGLIPIA